jgi:hypothetical protein
MPEVSGAAPSGQRQRGGRLELGAHFPPATFTTDASPASAAALPQLALASTLSKAPHLLSTGAQRCGRAGQRARTPPTLYWNTGRCCRMWCLTALTSVVRTCRGAPRRAQRMRGAQQSPRSSGVAWASQGSQHTDAPSQSACSALRGRCAPRRARQQAGLARLTGVHAGRVGAHVVAEQVYECVTGMQAAERRHTDSCAERGHAGRARAPSTWWCCAQSPARSPRSWCRSRRRAGGCRCCSAAPAGPSSCPAPHRDTLARAARAGCSAAAAGPLEGRRRHNIGVKVCARAGARPGRAPGPRAGGEGARCRTAGMARAAAACRASSGSCGSPARRRGAGSGRRSGMPAAVQAGRLA